MPLHKFKFFVQLIYYPFMTKRLVYFQMSTRKRSQIIILNKNIKNVTINEIWPYIEVKFSAESISTVVISISAITNLDCKFCGSRSWNGRKFQYVVVLQKSSLDANFQPPKIEICLCGHSGFDITFKMPVTEFNLVA